MNEYYLKHIENLNNSYLEERLNSLKALKVGIDAGEIRKPEDTNDVNNHIHTMYSFSPYSPTKAVWMAYVNGLSTAGIMDHDSVAGCEEFTKAGELIGLATTCGMELRVSMKNTRFSGKKLNNPDQDSVAYMAFHGIPHQNLKNIEKWIKKYGVKRNERNVKMVEKINSIMNSYGINLDFEKEIIPISKWEEGGSITERHLSYLLALKMVEKYGKGEKLVDFYKNTMNLPLRKKAEKNLMDSGNPLYEYDLLSAIKSDMIDKFYIPATEECPDVKEALKVAKENGCISAYAYLGDVGDSVTGDKKPQKFEDSYLDELFGGIKELGFNAVTYMPSRNTIEQLKRVKKLCKAHEFFEISGEDINSPRQGFICKAMRDKLFANLVDSTWALIGHEKMATEDIKDAMFGEDSCKNNPSLKSRIEKYKKIRNNYRR